MRAAPEINLQPGWMPAAGMLGFAPIHEWPLPEAPAAFVTHPISLNPRTPASQRTLVPYVGGFLLHTGWPNPGIKAVLKKYALRWARSPVPIWVHILMENPYQANRLVRLLEGVEGVSAVEIGLPPDCRSEEALDLVSACQGELPVVLSVPLDRAGEGWLNDVLAAGVSAISLCAPRGTLIEADETLISGRLYGPGLLPQTMRALQRLVLVGLPVIAGCGIYHQRDIDACLRLGASAVQLDAVLWRGWDQQDCV